MSWLVRLEVIIKICRTKGAVSAPFCYAYIRLGNGTCFFELTMHSDDRNIGKNTGIIRIIVAK